MNISRNWLKKYVKNIDSVSDEEIADRLTQQLAEVEGIRKIRGKLDKLVCGEVLEVEKHPNADKLNYCKVNIGSQKLNIVCGAPNVAVGQKVVVCMPGGKVFNSETGDQFEIKETKIRGLTSAGMICSEKELGISDEHSGILELPESFAVGSEIDDLLRDTIFEIENKSLTHRGDCFSHLGMAREISAIFDLELNKPEQPLEPLQTESLPLEIRVESESVIRFTALTIHNVKVEQSPLWLKLALSSIGLRSINNIVDITNYIMHDIGQPLHAYDYKRINENKIIVREGRKGEKFKAINHQEYTLSAGDVLITDNKGIHGIAGIMGAENSEVDEKTTDIILEAAVFDPDQILKTSRSLGLVSDASIRFSKKVDINRVLNALKQAANMITDLAGGEIASEILDIYPSKRTSRSVTLNLQDVNRKIGARIDHEHMLIFLERLGISIANKKTLNTTSNMINTPLDITAKIPSWRHDIKEPIDLIEEIARIHGYDKITPTVPTITLEGQGLPPLLELMRSTRSMMLRRGYSETITYSFLSEEIKERMNLQEKHLLKIENAISPELKYVRNSVTPSLVDMYQKNLKKQPKLKIFEIGRAVDLYNYTEEKLPAQKWHLGVMFANEYKDDSSVIATSKTDFLRFKGDIEQLLLDLGVIATEVGWKEVKKNENIFLYDSIHPYRAASLHLAGTNVGLLAEVNPVIVSKVASLRSKIFICELDLEGIFALDVIGKKEFENPVNLPGMVRDISLNTNEKLLVGELIKTARAHFAKQKGIRVGVELFDEYFTEKNERSITIRLDIQPLNETLSDAQANIIEKDLLKTLSSKFSVALRQ